MLSIFYESRVNSRRILNVGPSYLTDPSWPEWARVVAASAPRAWASLFLYVFEDVPLWLVKFCTQIVCWKKGLFPLAMTYNHLKTLMLLIALQKKEVSPSMSMIWPLLLPHQQCPVLWPLALAPPQPRLCLCRVYLNVGQVYPRTNPEILNLKLTFISPPRHASTMRPIRNSLIPTWTSWESWSRQRRRSTPMLLPRLQRLLIILVQNEWDYLTWCLTISWTLDWECSNDLVLW